MAPRIVAAQAPNVCVVPTTGNISRIGLEGLPGSCRAGHAGLTLSVQFPLGIAGIARRAAAGRQ